MDSPNTTHIIGNIENLKEDEQATNLGIMAAKIAFYNFEWRYTALIVFLTTPASHAVDAFLKHYNKSVAVKLGKYRPRYQRRVPQYVLFGEDSSEITEYVNWLIEMNYNNAGKYLLICYSTDYVKCYEKKIFKVLQNLYINNAIFLRISDGIEPIVFTYRIILPETCQNNKPEILNIRNGCVNDSCFKGLYPENFNNLHKCPLVVSTFDQPPFMSLYNGTREPTGGDADMLKVVTSALNATLVIKTPADGNGWGQYVDNNWTGSMGDIFNDRAHLSVCSLPLTSYKYGNFQVSVIYNTMDIVWVAKIPALEPSWKKLYRPFNIRARITLFVTFILVIILSGFTRTEAWRRTRISANIGNIKQSILFYSWVIFLGIPLVRVPSKRALLAVVYIWIWFCFILRNCYQAVLIHSLKKSVYHPNYISLYDVLNKNHTYGGQESYREYFVDEKKIYDNWQELDFKAAHEILHKISNGTSNFVLAYNKEMIIEHLLHHNGTRKVQMIPRKLVNSPAVMYLKKHSPLTAPLNIVLSRAIEAGYAQAWHMRFKRQKKVLFGRAKNRGPKALNLEDLGGCITVTIIGWVVSILFFIIEVFCGRMEEYND